jgi:hypothetical protein
LRPEPELHAVQPERQLRAELMPPQVGAGAAASAGAPAAEVATIYEVDVATVIRDLAPLVETLAARGRIPRDAVVRPLDSLDLRDVLELHAAFRCDAGRARSRLAGLAGDDSYCRVRSVVLSVAGCVIGAMLVQAERSLTRAFIYGVVVEPAWRHTWATAYLKHRGLARLQAGGTDVITFEASADSRDTHRHAARVRARVIGHRRHA